MKEFVEKLNEKLYENVKSNSCPSDSCWEHSNKDCDKCNLKKIMISDVIEIVNQLAEEYQSRIMIDGQYCWQACSATEHCKECNRLSNGDIDYYENYDVLAEEYNNGWIDCSERLPVYLDNVLVCTENGGITIAHIEHSPIEWVDMYMNKIDNVVAWEWLPNPYQKGE